jgi:calcium/proton exchanger cax
VSYLQQSKVVVVYFPTSPTPAYGQCFPLCGITILYSYVSECSTFGNAPELLIATAALRSGFYRVVQLAMLGSILTNLLFVFGMSCLIGGMRWQVQEIRVISGNVSVGMLYLATAGSLLPAALFLSGQLPSKALNDE